MHTGHNPQVPAQLKLVPDKAPGGAERIRQRLKDQKPPAILQCRCGSREMVQTKVGMLFKDGKASGGTKQYLCAHCLYRGERIVIA